MVFPERFSNLPEYAFPRLRKLLDAHAPGGEPIAMTIGEPRHPMPAFVGQILADNLDGFAVYPPNDGTPELLNAITAWIKRRYRADLTQDQVMVLNGTREGLFNSLIAVCPETKNGQQPIVLIPNPFYQVYAVAAVTVGAEPLYVPATAAGGFLPDYAGLPPEVLNRVAVAYICSPANPQGAVADDAYWRRLILLAHKHDFRIFADECYSEIWRDTAPTGILEASRAMKGDPDRILSFHSLSKRSNLPGLRSGFVVGGSKSVAALRQLRNYAGAPVPLPLQRVAERVWSDETHVVENRALYQQKFRVADQILGQVPGYEPPPAGFFLWLPVADGEQAALKLWRETGVRVLPGAYLARDDGRGNPGAGYIRVALVAPTQEMQRGLTLLRDCLYGQEG